MPMTAGCTAQDLTTKRLTSQWPCRRLFVNGNGVLSTPTYQVHTCTMVLEYVLEYVPWLFQKRDVTPAWSKGVP